MTAAALADRFASRHRNRGMGGLVLVALVIVAVSAVARTAVAARVFDAWLVAALPGVGFAVGGALVGFFLGSRPLLARTPASVLALAGTGAPAAADLADVVAGVYGAAVVSPVVLAAAVIAFAGGDRAILVCCWLLTALCAAAGAGWSALPVLRRSRSRPRGRSAEPVGTMSVAGTPVRTGEGLDAIAVVSIALRGAVVGTGVAAVATGVLSDSTVAWMGRRPAVAAAYAVAVALVAAPGAEAGCFASASFAALGPAAVVGFAATAAVCDVRFLRMLQMLVGRGLAWRTAVAAVPVLYAGAVWTGAMLR